MKTTISLAILAALALGCGQKPANNAAPAEKKADAKKADGKASDKKAAGAEPSDEEEPEEALDDEAVVE